MALEADLLVDRRRLKRHLSWWRAGAVALLVLALALAFGGGGGGLGQDHVARVQVRGVIGDDRKLMEALEEVARDRTARALIVVLDSPGGSVGGGEALYAAFTRIQQRKPVVAVMSGTAASAAYMAALPAERIFAREATVTGSIGVLLQSIEASELLTRLGVRAETLTSGPLKDQPSPFHPLSAEGRAALDRVIQDIYAQFVEKVAKARNMPEARVRELADGRVFTGRQAVGLGLVDAIGGEREARAWLAGQKNVAEGLPVREVEPRSVVERLLGDGAQGLVKILVSEWLGVDAVRMVWQPRLIGTQ